MQRYIQNSKICIIWLWICIAKFGKKNNIKTEPTNVYNNIDVCNIDLFHILNNSKNVKNRNKSTSIVKSKEISFTQCVEEE